MGKVWTLLLLELRSLYGINRFLHTKDKKEKTRSRGLLIAWGFLIIMLFTYVSGLVYGLCGLGLQEIVPVYLVVIASLLILVLGLFRGGNRIFAQTGYDLLVSLPVKHTALVLSRFLAMYLEDLILTGVILLPGIVTYGICQRPGAAFYLFFAAGALFVPAIPMVLSALLGTLAMTASSRMKSKTMVQSVLMVLLVVGIMAASFRMESAADAMTEEAFLTLAQQIGTVCQTWYPPAMWLGQAAAQSDVLGLCLFVLVSAAVLALAAWLVAINYHSIMNRLSSTAAKHDYQVGTMKRRGLLKTLYIREAKRYVSSSIYVTNTIIGPIMGAIMAVALAVSGLDTVQAAFPVDISGLLPFVFAAVTCMMTTTSVSISMEGKQFWVIQSLPIPTKALLDSKILWNLSLMLPFYMIAQIAMGIALQPDALQLLWTLLIPACVMLFSVVVGITVNLKFHSFDWDREETVVKQSLSALLGGFAGVLLTAVLVGIVLLVPAQYSSAVKAAECVLVLALTGMFYRKNNKAVLSRL